MLPRLPLSLAIASGALLLAAAAAADVPTLGPDALRPGQRAVVRTVFEGTRVDTFAAVIVGVLRGGPVSGDMILARATSERVVRTGVAQGMSGSPVYVDGRLIGALSSGWPFMREPVFGITPIGEMLEVLALKSAAGPGGSAGPSGVDVPGRSTGVTFRGLSWSDAPAETPTAPAGTVAARGPAPLPLPLACSGLNPGALESVGRWLAPFGFNAVPGGRSPGGGPPADSLVPGSAVAVDLLSGDLRLSAIGTLTYRDGDRVLIFGHPFFQSGDVRMPLSSATIATVIASDLNSFKLGMPGQPAGVVTQDRRTALGGRIGGVARMLPVAVTIRAPEGRRAFHFASIEDRALAPTLVGIATTNSVLESGSRGGNQTLRWTMRLYRPAAPPLTLSDVAAGDSPPREMAAGLVSPLAFLFGNPFQSLALDSIAVDVEVDPGRERWTLRAAQVLDPAVRPGGEVRVRCELEPWRGGREVRVLTLRVPEEAPEGRYRLWLGGGAELTRYEAQHAPGHFRPTSFDDAWSRLGALRSTAALYAALLATAPEVTSDGRDYPELPVSALMLLASDQRAGDAARRGDTAWLDERRLALGGPVQGELMLSVTVDDRAP